MKTLFLTFALVCFSFIGMAQAELSIAVVSVEDIYNSSKAAKSIKSQQNKLTDEFEAQFKKETDKLEARQKELQKQSADFSPDELKTKGKEFQKQVVEGREKLQKKRADLQKALLKAEADLQRHIIDVSEDIAKEKNYDLVVPKQSTIVVNTNLDITPEVLKRLDAKVTNIKVTVGK